MVITQAKHKENPQANALQKAARGKTNHHFATRNVSWRMATPAETSQRRFMAAAKVLIGIPSARAASSRFSLFTPSAESGKLQTSVINVQA